MNHHTNNEINGMLSYPRGRIINDKNYIFLFLTSFSVKDKSFLSPAMAKFRPRRWWVLVSLVSSFALFRVRGADGDASIHLFTLSLLWKWLWLSVIMALNALKLFNCRSQGLHSRCGLNSFPGRVPPYTASAAASNSSFDFLKRFLQYLKSLTEPRNLQQLWFPLSDDG